MKRTVLEKLKVKQLGDRLVRERVEHAADPGARDEDRSAQLASAEFDRLLRRILEKK